MSALFGIEVASNIRREGFVARIHERCLGQAMAEAMVVDIEVPHSSLRLTSKRALVVSEEAQSVTHSVEQ